MTEQFLDVWSRERSAGRLSLWQRFVRWITGLLARFVPSLIGGLDPASLALMVDVSHWQGPNLDVALMRRDGKISALLPKMSDGFQIRAGVSTDLQNYVDPTFRLNVDKAYKSGIPCIPYHFCQYVKYGYTNDSMVNDQVKIIKEALRGLIPGVSFHGISLDVEVENSTGPNVAYITMGIYKALKAAYPNIPIIFYTSLKYLNLYPNWANGICSQGMSYNIWFAQYVWNTGIVTTWADLWARIIPSLNMSVMRYAFEDWWAVQWTGDRITLPGCYGKIDLNAYHGTEAQLWKWLNFTPPVIPPEPEPAPGLKLRVIAQNLNIRSGPGTAFADVGDLHAGDIVTATGISAATYWVEIEPGKWACGSLNGVKYMEVIE